MQEQGHYIIEGLLLGITDFLSKIKKKFEEIRNLVTEKMDNIKSSAVSKVNEMKKGLSDGVETGLCKLFFGVAYIVVWTEIQYKLIPYS